MAAPAPRKPVQSNGVPVRCFCKAPELAHPTEDCSKFQARPCTCGHPYSLHLGACNDRACSCKAYRSDMTPEFLLRAGIRAGEWQFGARPRFEALMRPDNPPWLRAYACLMLHADPQNTEPNGRNRARLAKVQASEKCHRPLLPDDILRELNAADPLGRLTKQNLRRDLLTVERKGLARKVGKTRKNIRLYVYLRPLTSREVEDEESEFGSLTTLPNPANPQNPEDLRSAAIVRLQGSIVKSARSTLEKLMQATPDLVVPPDYQTVLDEAAREAALVVCAAYQKLGLGVCVDTAYKEVNISSSSSDDGKSSTRATSSKAVPVVRSEPAKIDDAVPAFYAKLTGRGWTTADEALLRSLESEGISEVDIMTGIATSVFRAPSQINSFNYCQNEIRQSAESEIQDRETRLKHIVARIAQKNRNGRAHAATAKP